jgi:MerR family transcriptional regulator/heat shock protein HspR
LREVDPIMATPVILPREVVAEHLSVSPRLLLAYEARGLVRAVSDGTVEGYGPPEVHRLWSIVTLQRDCGVNLAGVEAILELRDHVTHLHDRVAYLAQRLHEALEADLGPDHGRA